MQKTMKTLGGIYSMALLGLLMASSCTTGCKAGKIGGSKQENNSGSDPKPSIEKTVDVLPVGLKDLATGTHQIEYEGTSYTLVVADLDSADIQLHYKSAEGQQYFSIQTLLKALNEQGKEVLMITNGGMYLTDGSPQGLYIEGGKQLVPLDTADPNDNNFYLLPNGVFYIDSSGAHVAKTTDYPTLATDSVYWATQSGPLLVYNDSIHHRFRSGSDNKHFRNAVGVRADGKVIFAISNITVNFYDMGCLFQHALGCPNALYLDGFVSRMYAPPFKKDVDGHFGPIISVTKKQAP